MIDKTPAIDSTNMLPSFRIITERVLKDFIIHFQNENPISTVDIQDVNQTKFSLAKMLDQAFSSTKGKTHTKEIVLLIFSLTVHDVPDFKEIIKHNVRISVVSFLGEITVLKNLCSATNGKLYVPLDEYHFKAIMDIFVVPRGSVTSTITLLKAGFPKMTIKSYCMCHLKDRWVYECVICKAYLCQFGECIICHTLNIDGMSLYKNSYYFGGIKQLEVANGMCICGKEVKYKCECSGVYCDACSEFVKEGINFCIYCGE